MTVVLAALDSELSMIVSGLSETRQWKWHRSRVIEGAVGAQTLVAASTGVGKTFAAMAAQHLIDTVGPDRIIVVGVAGAVDPTLQVGDTVIARDCVQHDVDVTALGSPRGEIPFPRYRFLKSDPRLVECARRIAPLRGRSVVGRVLTGDTLVVDPGLRDSLRSELDGHCVEMEGASVGLVSAANGVPFLIVRTISDLANGAKTDFRAAMELAAANSWHYLRGILESIQE